MPDVLWTTYLGADNPCELDLEYTDDDGQAAALPLSAVTRVTLLVQGGNAGADLLVDSDAGGAISWTAAGRITAQLGAAQLSAGEYPVRVRLYDSAHPNGQFVTYPDTPNRVLLRVKA